MGAESSSEWRETYHFLEPDEIGSVYVVGSTMDDSSLEGPGREDIFYDFSRRRVLRDTELSPDLSTSILERYGLDPYSEDRSTMSRVMLSPEGGEFLRVGDRDNAVYFEVGDASLPDEPDYVSEEEPRWRS